MTCQRYILTLINKDQPGQPPARVRLGQAIKLLTKAFSFRCTGLEESTHTDKLKPSAKGTKITRRPPIGTRKADTLPSEIGLQTTSLSLISGVAGPDQADAKGES